MLYIYATALHSFGSLGSNVFLQLPDIWLLDYIMPHCADSVWSLQQLDATKINL